MRQGPALVDLRCNVQQHTIDEVHYHPQGWPGWTNVEVPIAIGPACSNGFEMVVSRWRVVDCLPSLRCLRGKRGARGKDQISSAERPRRKTFARPEAKIVARPYRDPES